MTKIKSASPNAPRRNRPRIKFGTGDILNCDYPTCDAILLLDVLHYWTPEKQQLILNKARQALRSGGRLILRDAARAENQAHRRVDFWEKIATRFGHNKTGKACIFRPAPNWKQRCNAPALPNLEIKPGAGRDSNLLLVATAGPT